jgi:hypothetical protein
VSVLMQAAGTVIIKSFSYPNDSVVGSGSLDTLDGDTQPNVYTTFFHDSYVGTKPNPSPGPGGALSIIQGSIDGTFWGTRFYDDRATFNVTSKESDRLGGVTITGTESGLTYTIVLTSLDTADANSWPQYSFTLSRPANVVASGGSNNYISDPPFKRPRGF